MINTLCLNHNDPQVKLWFENVGQEETYRQFVKHGDILPDWARYSKEINFQEARNFLKNFIPAEEYKYEKINSLLNRLPIGTQAAFWQNTFYFKNSITSGELGEEAFHAVISTILTPSERVEFYNQGQALIESKGLSISALVNEGMRNAPQSYAILSDEQRRQRAIEEHVAGLFRQWFNKRMNLPQTLGERIGNFFQDLFTSLLRLFAVGGANRHYMDSLFRDIANGKYRKANVLFDENATPTTYQIIGTSGTGSAEIVSEAESEQVLRNLVANYFIAKQEMDSDAAREETLRKSRLYYNAVNKVVASSLVEDITTLSDEGEMESSKNPNFVSLMEEFDKRVKRVKGMMYDLIEEDQGEGASDENAERQGGDGLGHSDAQSSNEKGFDSMSDWLKTYFKTISTTHTIKLSNDTTLEFAEAVDENKIYYGVARALNNSKNDFERLIKLVTYGELKGNSAAKALLHKVLQDSSGKKDVKGIIENIKNDYMNIYRVERNPGLINKYIHPDRAYILQNVLKGFDLWSRTTMFQSISPESGSTITSNANVNNSTRTQIARWQQQAPRNTPLNVRELDRLVNEMFVGSPTLAQDLEKVAGQNQRILRNVLGISVSTSALKWLLLNKMYSTTPENEINISMDDKVEYRAFESEIKTYGAKEEIESIISNIKSYVTPETFGDLYETVGNNSRLEKLAKINALFDESVFESSYKNAEGKTVYGFQWKTFDLEFVANLQDEAFTDSLMNNGIISYRKDENGNDVYLTESQEFITDNVFLRALYTRNEEGRYVKNQNSVLSKILPYMKLESLDGLRQTAKDGVGREGEGVTFSNMLTKDFDMFRLNAVVNRTIQVEGLTLYPHYIGNLEAKRTADFVYLPEIRQTLVENGRLTDGAVARIRAEVRKEYNRIKRVNQEIGKAINDNIPLLKFNEEGIAKLDSTLLRTMLGRDVFEKYHTGTVKREGENGPYTYMGARALEFTDSIKGVMDKNYMSKELARFALENETFDQVWEREGLTEKVKDHWENVIFAEHYDRLAAQNLVPLLDSQWKIGKEFDKNKFEHFITSSFLNVMSFNQMMHGDFALILKNDGADFAKRKGGANAAIQSAETYLIAPLLGITEVKDRIKFVTANEMTSVVAYDPGSYVKKNGKDVFEPNTIDQADAQNYATTEYKRYLLWSRGKLDKFLASTLDDIELGYALTPKQQREMLKESAFLNVDKTVAYNGVQYMKKSDFMLTKEFTSVLTRDAQSRLKGLDKYSDEARAIRMDENNWIARPDVKWHHDLRQNMEGWRYNVDGTLVKDANKRYDLYMPTSASKMLNVNVYNPSTGWNNIDGSIMHIDAKNYGLQLENPAGKERIIDPSQMLEIIFNEQEDNVEVYYKGELTKMATLENLYQDYLTRRDNTMMDIAYNEIFDENGEFDATTFFPKMVSSLITSGADPQVIQLFSLNKETGKPEYNSNMGITKEKFTNQLFAQFTKAILQQKVAGDALAHVSSYGIRPLKKIRRIILPDGSEDFTWDVIKRDTADYNAVTYGAVKAIDLNLERLPMNGVIYDLTRPTDRLRSTLKDMYYNNQMYFTDELRHLKPRYNVTDVGTDGTRVSGVIAYYSESLMPASRIDDQTPTKRNRWNFGVRIPSQDKHSAVNVEWVDTLPMYYGNTITTAKEIVTISGSDFDIDKLFLQKPELYKWNNQWWNYGEQSATIEQVAFLKDFHKGFQKEYDVLLESVEEDVENPEWVAGVNGILERQRLPALGTMENPYVMNNELLTMKQLALTNDGMIKPKDGREAIYKTAATMDVLKDLDKLDMFRRTDGTSVFATNDRLPNHMFAKHSMVHTKNSVGKANITPYVNGTLGLILAVRGGFKVNKPFQMEINGHRMTGFSALSAEGRRAFDTISSLISAATDEAKEQLNAKYNLNYEGAGIVKTMVSLGWELSTAIAFVNQPIVRKFLAAKEAREQTVYIEKDFKWLSDEDIIKDLVNGGLDGAYNGVYGNEELGAVLTGKDSGLNQLEFDKRILKDLNTINMVTQQLGELLRYTKMKKGFGGGIDQLDALNSAYNTLGLDESTIAKDFVKARPLNTHKLLDENFSIRKKLPQVVNVIEKIVPRMNRVANKLLLDRNSGLTALKFDLFNQLKSLDEKSRKGLIKDMESYLYMRLFREQVGDQYEELLTENLFKRSDNTTTVGATFLALKAEVARIEEEGALTKDERILSNLIGTSILQRLTVKENGEYDELRLDTFAKLSLEEQDTLIASYSSMIRNLSHLSDDKLEYKDLPKQLFAYWVMKDGFQSKFGSISKLFPVYMFKDHSESIDRALAGTSEMFNSMSGTTLNDVFVKDILERYTNSAFNRKNLKTFYISKGKAPLLHKEGAFSLSIDYLNGEQQKNGLIRKRTLDEKINILNNYPFGYVVVNDELSITNVPLFLKGSAETINDFGESEKTPVTLSLNSVKLNNGTELKKTDVDFVSQMMENINNISVLRYAPKKVTYNKFQSDMTLDLDYSPIIKTPSPEFADPTDYRQTFETVTTEGQDLRPYKYYGAPYQIVVENGVGIDVVGYKGKLNRKQKLLDAYNANPLVDSQSLNTGEQITSQGVQTAVVPTQQPVAGESFTFPDGTVVETDFKLSDEQEALMNSLHAWYMSPTTKPMDNMYLVQGSAGSGKSSAIGYFLKYLEQTKRIDGSQIGLSSPSHKANKVLYKFVSGIKTKFGRTLVDRTLDAYNNNVFTTQAAFGVQVRYDARTQGVVLDNRRTSKGYAKLSGSTRYTKKKVWIIDEVSLLAEAPKKMAAILSALEHYAMEDGIKIIMMGDNKQLKSVSTGELSPLFKHVTNQSVLVKEQRQKAGNPILETLAGIKDSIDNKKTKNPLATKIGKYNVSTGKGVVYHNSLSTELKDIFKSEEYKSNRELIKIISRSNASVTKYNDEVRQHIFNNPGLYEVGDTLMGYQQKGGDSPFYNGQEYKVEEVVYDVNIDFKNVLKEELLKNKQGGAAALVDEYFTATPMNIHQLKVRENNPLFLDMQRTMNIATFKTSSDVANFEQYSLAVERIADKMAQLYTQKNNIWSDRTVSNGVKWGMASKIQDDIDKLTGLLNTASSLIQIQDNMYTSKKTGQFVTESQIRTEMEEMHRDKLEHPNYRNIVQGAMDAVQYQEKTIDYGYAVTVTKSQGSTYPYSVVDLESVEGKNDYWFQQNPDDALRAEYVAISRASGVSHLITRDPFTNKNEEEDQSKDGCGSSLKQ